MKKNLKRWHLIFILAGLLAGGIFTALVVMLPLPGMIPVLMYHFIGTDMDAKMNKNYVSEASFEKQMKWINRLGYKTLTLEEYAQIWQGKRKPQGKEILVTFDDGHHTFENQAYPALKKHKIHCAMFLISDRAGQGLYGSMPEGVIKKLWSEGHLSYGSHSKTHPYLTQMSSEQMVEEIKGSKLSLEAMLGLPMKAFAYPYGDVNPPVAEEVRKAGYDIAFTTSYKKVRSKQLPAHLAIPRVKISRSADNWFVFWAKVSGLYQFFKGYPPAASSR